MSTLGWFLSGLRWNIEARAVRLCASLYLLELLRGVMPRHNNNTDLLPIFPGRFNPAPAAFFSPAPLSLAAENLPLFLIVVCLGFQIQNSS